MKFSFTLFWLFLAQSLSGDTFAYISGFDTGNIYVVNTVSQSTINTINAPNQASGSCHSLAIDPFGVLAMMVNASNNVCMVDLQTGKPLHTLSVSSELGPFSACNFSGNAFYVLGQSQLTVFSFVGNTTTTATFGIAGVDVDFNGNYAFVVSSDTLYVFDNTPLPNSPPVMITTLPIGSGTTAIATSQDNAFITNQNSNEFKVIDITTPASPSIIVSLGGGMFDNPQDVCLSPGALTAYVSNLFNDTVSFIDITVPGNPSVFYQLSDPNLMRPTAVAVTEDGQNLYVVNSIFSTVGIFNTLNKTNIKYLSFPNEYGTNDITNVNIQSLGNIPQIFQASPSRY